ncbi:hypothetical protein QTP70_031178 [Hemibagrus guttatus]|uniref:Uncharacterized protein n=1 Tax=Hemibagrus guttatus TaxID=175788 RepID=A0AAE0Q7L1_9TELE|nr:hypothetical protein QTP70_031178 [Hemibagrus guttatus]
MADVVTVDSSNLNQESDIQPGSLQEEKHPEEEPKAESNNEGEEREDCSNSGVYRYIKEDLFTSEIFKVQIQNLPRYIGFNDLKKFLNKHGLNPHKIKLMGKQSFAFVTFKNQEDRDKAMKLVHGVHWKGKFLSVRLAKPKADPLLRKRRQDEEAADGGQPAPKRPAEGHDGGGDEPLSIQLANVVTPLWRVPYPEQLRRKEQEVEAVLHTLTRTVVRAAMLYGLETVSLRKRQESELEVAELKMLSTLNFIPDRSRPGLTTTAIGAVDLQGAGGNWATVGGRSRGGRRVHRPREKRKGKSVGLRIGTLNVGTMTGKGRELADMMERRKVDILCVQETRWKGSKARSIGAGFKLFYYGVDSKRNGVGVVLKEEFVRNVLEVKRVSDRVMSLKLEIEGVMLNVVSGYAPQVGCELEEKERFWSELDEVMESIPTGERVVIGADFNGHVGEGNTGDEEVMGRFGVKERNLEGQMVVDFAKRMDMGVVNTYFQKREEHRVTYKSGGRRTQVDYILCRRGNLKEISDCKVVVGESVARQHRMVVCRMTLMVCKKKRSEIEIEKKTKWWKLKKEECCEEFRQKLRQALGGQVVLPDDWETTAEVIRETGRKVLGVSSGRRKEDKETWWWNEEVQDSVQRKRLAKKKWDMDRTEENRQEYKELQRRVKREVSKAKQKAYEELYTRLDTREGEKDLYRLARQRDRDGKDVQQVRVIKDRDGRVLTSEESVQRRWKEYFEELMNEENEREKRVEGVNSVEQKVDKIRKDEVRKALKRMKSGKAVGPDDIPVEVWKCLGEAAVEFLTSLFNRVLESERMPEEWRRSVLVPIFKNKGDVQSCSNYRGIKLMSHTMKVWERVVEARLRKVVEICEQQYGFMPRKSTTDAIFALRILMEKYRDGQRELHCVFVDLEKAYDRVPREELWYCMRKSGVAEKYVRVVQDMYERSRTVVRCAVGQTEEFKVEVGLHQGSALSPFLFAIVMDQLSEEVRQESPWTMMFADDIVICSESREQVEENLERWRFALERRGMKVSRSKTEYMCVNEREGSGTVRLQGEEVKKVQEFKDLGSTVQSNGECGKEIKKRVQAGWNGWRKVWGVLCERKISARIKGKVYRTVVRAAMLYGLETVSLRKRQESELEVAELKMLREIGNSNKSMLPWLFVQKERNKGVCCPLEPIKPSPVQTEYRNKCEFVISTGADGEDKTVGFRLGKYKGGSCAVVSPSDTIHVPEGAKRVVLAFQDFIRSTPYAVYSPETYEGHWRQLTVRTSRTNQIMAVVFFHPQKLDEDETASLKESLRSYFTDGEGKDSRVTSLHFVRMGQRTSGVSEDLPCELVAGEPWIHEELLGLRFRISPHSFFQTNTLAAEVLYSSVGEWAELDQDTTLLDVCCGTGTIGISLAKRVRKVIGIDLCQEAVNDAKVNAEANGLNNVEYHCGKAEDIFPSVLNAVVSPNVTAIVDPPRAGLHSRVILAIRRAEHLKRLVYVTCNAKGAMNNFIDLCRAPSNRVHGAPFRPVRAMAVDLFPQTAHCENVLLFQRVDYG